jgi:hypothetical protein
MFPRCNNGSVLVSLSLFRYIQQACSKSYWTGPNSFPRDFNVLPNRESNWVQYIGFKVVWTVTTTVLGVCRLDVSLIAVWYMPDDKQNGRPTFCSYSLTWSCSEQWIKYLQASPTIVTAQFPFAASSVMHVHSMTNFRTVTIFVTVYSIKWYRELPTAFFEVY